jgi:hypothetical protein
MFDTGGNENLYKDITDPHFISIFERVKPHSITAAAGPLPLLALYSAIEHIVKHDIPGDIAECGVWNGGSMLLAALALMRFGDTSRRIYLYDTFSGMPKPDGELDKDWNGMSALETWQNFEAAGKRWGFGGTVEMVRQVMLTSGYPEDKLVFVPGMVEDTLPATKADRLSLLRLDTDLHHSTYHELVHLYPTLSSGGILIIDDYGYFEGAKKATDQYMAENQLRLFLNRVDSSVRLAVKP